MIVTSLDWMYVRVYKTREDADYADYVYFCNLTIYGAMWDEDDMFSDWSQPGMASTGLRKGIEATHFGRLKLRKLDGDMAVTLPMPGDADKRHRDLRAMAAIRKQWLQGIIPDQAMYACG